MPVYSEGFEFGPWSGEPSPEGQSLVWEPLKPGDVIYRGPLPQKTVRFQRPVDVDFLEDEIYGIRIEVRVAPDQSLP